MRYAQDQVQESDVTDIAQLAPVHAAPPVSWVEVDGFGDEAGLRQLADLFGIHPLALADVVNVPQRPEGGGYEGHRPRDRVDGASRRRTGTVRARAGELRDRTALGDQLRGASGEDVFDPVR